MALEDLMTQLKLFTDVSDYYTALEQALGAAQHHIHLAYYAFDEGQVARKISHILAHKAASGVAVHLMVDEAGLYLDHWPNSWRNLRLLAQLRESGVQVDLFRPSGTRLSQFNRLHCKFCAIDDRVAFVGGSNIGDHYLKWRDTNLRLSGGLGDGFAQLYAGLRSFGGTRRFPNCPTSLSVAGMPLLLTVPGRRQDIRRALLGLILSARTAVSLRSWYFLPDAEIMNALLSQAEKGVRVTVLLSHRTRVSLIDLANRHLCRQLAQAGAYIHRYNGRFMHAKEAWNDQGEILLGSANIDRWALRTNFECCLHLHDMALASQLSHECRVDAATCCPATSQWQERPLFC
jgi:cardiolipin synthase